MHEMAAATKKDSGLRSWIYPKGSGIRIREILNLTAGAAFGASYLVTVPSKITGGLRSRKQFKTKVEAEEHADNEYGGYRKQGHDFFAMSDEERREVAVSLPLLREAKIRLGDAVQFAIKRMRAEGRDKTLGQVVAELVTSKEQRHKRGDLRERSYRDFRHRGAKFVSGFEGRIAGEVTADQIKAWLNGQKLGPRTNQNYLAIIGEVYRYAVQKRYVASSPIDELTDVDRKELCGGGPAEAEPNILTPEQAERLLRAAHANPDLGLLAPVTLSLFCGLRTEEVKRLEWSHVKDAETHPVVTITAKIAKKRRIRHVDIPANAIRWLSLCGDREGLVSGSKYVSDYQKRFRKLTQLAGFGKEDAKGEWISSWENNAMRHSFGTYHYALHGNPLETSRQLGHKASDQVLFDHYRALATKKQADAFFAIVPPAKAGKVVKFK